MKKHELTLDDLKTAVNAVMNTARENLYRNRMIAPVAIFLGRESHVVPLNGRHFQSGRNKDMLASALKAMVIAQKARGFIMLSDGWALYRTDEQKARCVSSNAEFMRLSRKGVPAVAAAGYGELMESLVCQGQTPKYFYNVQQRYQRITPDGVIPGTAMLEGPPPDNYTIRFHGEEDVMSSDNSTIHSGRFAELFK